MTLNILTETGLHHHRPAHGAGSDYASPWSRASLILPCSLFRSRASSLDEARTVRCTNLCADNFGLATRAGTDSNLVE